MVLGDLGDHDTIVNTWKIAEGAAVGPIGFACQPYSLLDLLGDGKQGNDGNDARSACLTHALALAILIRLQVVILECVTPALQSDFVKAEVQRFLNFTGFHMTSVELKLHDVWVSRRNRAL